MLSRRLGIILAAIVLPAAVTAAVGLRSLAEDVGRAETRYREQAEAALEEGARSMASVLARLAEGGGGAVPLLATAEGTLLEPAPATPAARLAAERAALDPTSTAALAALEEAVERDERAGRPADAIARLRVAADEAGQGDDARAAALTALGAIARREGDIETARGAWTELVARHPESRDRRGLPRALAARFALATTPAVDLAALVATLADCVEADRDPDDVAVRVLKQAAMERTGATGAALAGADAARLESALRRDAERGRTRDVIAAWRSGGAIWAAQGAPGGARALGSGAGEVVLALRPDPEGRLRGGADAPSRLLALASEAPGLRAFASLEIRITFEPASDAVSPPASLGPSATSMTAAPVLARRPLGAPFAGRDLVARGSDALGFVRAERRRLWIAGAAALAALATAIVASIAALRAVSREVEAARARERFVAAVTHELRTPLAAIRLLAEVLSGADLEDAKRRELAGHVLRESDRLSRLVAQVLELARIEQGSGSADGRADARKEPIDLAALARTVVEIFAPLARKGGFTIAPRLPEGGGSAPPVPPVRGDPDALAGALLNLLDNAVKYADAPHEITLAVEPREGGRGARILVLDRGRGVAPRDRERIFTPFARGGDELTRDRPGTGLGLALVRGVAEAHGGRATYAPREGGGSVFAIELPRAEGSAS